MGLDDNADLYYPEEFLGAWQCVSVLRSIEVPNGVPGFLGSALLPSAFGVRLSRFPTFLLC